VIRKRLFARLYPVLEIGPGPGTNLAYLPPGVQYLALEPNPFFHPRLREEARKRGLALTLLPGRAEAIPLPEGSVDLVVGTLVLCSVKDPRKALAEVHRVLRPGGAYLFLEHVAAPKGTPLRFLQEAATPLFFFLGDGCHPNRDDKKSFRSLPSSKSTRLAKRLSERPRL